MSSFAPQLAAVAVIAYLMGSIPFGLLISRMRGIDIRKHGSGNIGATNVWRVLGKKWGLTTFLCDMGKGLAAVVIAKCIAHGWPATIALPHGHEKIAYLDAGAAGIAAAVACILGHSFPVWLKFKGGKGVATSLGVIGGMMPVASLTIFAVWGLVFWLTRYVSLASLAAAAALPVVVIGLLFAGWMESWAYFYFSVAATLLVYVRHYGNIRRLLAGTESRFGSKKPKETPDEHAPEKKAE